ncbi:MAG: GNAT family N-acetyltransferase [Cyanobacteria bacterium J06635_10]
MYIDLSDVASIHHNLSDPQTVIYSNTNQPPTVKQVEKIIKVWQKRFEEQKGIRWGITKRGNNEVIGSCGYKNLINNDKKAEIGYEIFSDYRRKGFMSEALHEVIRFGFETMQLNYIEATVNPNNLPSIYFLNKLGFVEKILLEDYNYQHKNYSNMKLFVLSKNN